MNFRALPPIGSRPNPHHLLSKNLMGHWAFNGSGPLFTGYRTLDSSLNNNYGVVYGDISQVEAGIYLPGSPSRIEIPDNNTLDFRAHDLSFTVWIRTGTTSGGSILRKASSSAIGNNNYDSYGCYMYADGKINAAFRHTASWDGDAAVVSTKSYNDSRTHCITAVYKRSSNLELYIDDVLIGTADISYAIAADINFTQNLALGCRKIQSGPTYDLYWAGYISNASLFNRALLPCEVRSLYVDSSQVLKPLHNTLLYTFVTEGWSGKICGVTNPSKVCGIDVANITKVCGI